MFYSETTHHAQFFANSKKDPFSEIEPKMEKFVTWNKSKYISFEIPAEYIHSSEDFATEMLRYHPFMAQCYSETKHHAYVFLSESAFGTSFTNILRCFCTFQNLKTFRSSMPPIVVLNDNKENMLRLFPKDGKIPCLSRFFLSIATT